MKRVLWLGIGLAVGVLVYRKATRAAQQFTPSGMAATVSHCAGNLVESVRSFVADVRDGMAEREQEIHTAMAEGVLFTEDDPYDDVREDDSGFETPKGTR
jgi:hypothetical protein